MTKLLFYGIAIQIFFTGLLLASDGLAQDQVSIEDVYLSLDLKDATLEQTLAAITYKTNFKFAFEQKNIEKIKSLSTNVSNESLADILRGISKSTDLCFKRVNDNIFVTKKKLFDKSVEEDAIASGLFQGISITGMVVSGEDNSPLPGVNIVLKGTSIGTVTDIEGNYSLEVPDENSVLVFSSVGFVSEEIVVGSRTVIDIVLGADVTALSEIVVVGYGTQKRAEVTGAVESVDSDKINAIPVANLSQALQGRASGVTVINNGSPGNSPTIRIRGLGTINNNEPLYVVDGVISSSIDGLNQNDIESIDVLKDASTTAVYGSKGSNGVIMITTKSGKAGKVSVGLNTYAGTQWTTKRFDLMNTEQYIQYATDLGSLPEQTIPSRITDPQYADFLENDTDWQDQIFTSGMIQNYDLSVSGGGESSNFRISAGYISQDGVIINTGMERYNFRANSNFTAGRFKFGETLSLSISNLKPETNAGGRSVIEHTIKMAPYFKVYNPDNLGGYQGPTSSIDGQDAENPVRIREHGGVNDQRLNLIGNIFAEYEIFDGLKLQTQLGAELSNSRYESFVPSFRDGGAHVQNFSNIAKHHSDFQTVIWTNSLTYDKTFADKHNLQVLLLSESTSSSFKRLNTRSTNALTDEIEEVSNSEPNLSSNSSEYFRLGYLLRVNYNFNSKYLFAVSMRRDASSRFGENNQWGTFPSVSAGWRISEEGFLNSSSFLNNLKLRASWGITGNDNIPDYVYMSGVLPIFHYPINGSDALGASVSGLPNPDVKWEETSMLNVGFDFGFLNDQVTASIEYYNNESNDLLMPRVLPISSGFHQSTVIENVGSMKTTGWEFNIGYNDSEGEFQWSANLNLGTSRNEVLDLGDNDAIWGGGFENENISKTVVGEQAFQFFGWKFDGVFQSDDEVSSYKGGTQNASAGDLRIVDTNGDGVISSDDRTFIGNPFPKLTYGLNLGARYKGFDLDLFFNGISDVDVYNTNLYDLEGMPRLFNAGTSVLERWTGPGTSNTIPRALGAGTNTQVSDRFVENGSFARLRNLSIGYNFASTLFNGKVSKFRIYISAQNLITITDYSGLDPEVGQYIGSEAGNAPSGVGTIPTNANGQPNVNFETGIDRGNYPMPKSFVGGIQFQF